VVDVRIVGAGEDRLFDRVAAEVFDGPIDPRWLAEFLADPRHHLAVAIEDGLVVGFASGIHYVHPDKAPELFVIEVGVSDAFRRQGIGRRLLAALFERGRTLGCAIAWVATGRSNAAARALYTAAGGLEDEEEAIVYSFPLAP
jgi:aminoglycoside 6'-N-acetyltransferase I